MSMKKGEPIKRYYARFYHHYDDEAEIERVQHLASVVFIAADGSDAINKANRKARSKVLQAKECTGYSLYQFLRDVHI